MLNIGIIGVGTVGQSVCQILEDNKDIITARAGVELNVVSGVVNNLSKERDVSIKLTNNVDDILNDDSIDIVVELMGGVEQPYDIVKKALEKGKLALQKIFLWATLALTILFIYFQFTGFSEIISQGYYFTGAASSINTSFIYVLVLLHLAHVFGGLIVLSIVIIQTYRNAYSPDQKLGYELAELFWHFLDFLWIYLYVFLTVYS